MATVAINGVTLSPQPAFTRWEDAIIDSKLDGTESTGAYRLFTIRAPKIGTQTFNWQTYENQVLTSIQCYAPGTGPESANVVYSSGAVSRKIKVYEMPEDRTVSNVEMQIAVIV